MTSNRISYDDCSYKQYMHQSVAPVNYALDPIKYEHCNKCRIDKGVVGGVNVSHIKGNLVDLENDLRGQTRPVTQCDKYMYSPPTGNTLHSQEYIKQVHHPVIDTTPVHMDTCKMFDYHQLPPTPPMNLFKCPKK